MNLNELKEDYARTLDSLLYHLRQNRENECYSKEEISGYERCIQDVEKYFNTRLDIYL